MPRRQDHNYGAALWTHLEPLEQRLLLAIDIFAAGQTNEETMLLLVDNQVVQQWDRVAGDALAGQFSMYSADVPTDVTPDRIKIAFVNDVYDPANNVDRNLRIDAIHLHGQRYETESTTVFSTGTWKPEDGVSAGFRESEFLHTNGYFRFGTSQDGSVIVVHASGQEGQEQFVLTAGGQEFSPVQVSTSLSPYTFRTDQRVAPESVRIEFVNDFFDPGSDIDFNLTVDKIVVDGVTFESEAPNTFVTGAYLPGVGITSGFLYTETIHTSGYFQYGGILPPSGEYVLDDSFGVSGVAQVPNAVTEAFAPTNGGQLVSVNRQLIGSASREFVRRMNADGSLDRNFGQNGEVDLIPLFASVTGQSLSSIPGIRTSDIAVDAQDRVVIVARVFPEDFSPGSGLDFTVALRLNADGSLDTTLPLNGLTLGGNPTIQQVSVSPDGSIALAGQVGSTYAVFGYRPDGTLDSSFGSQGINFIAADTIPSFDGIQDVYFLEHAPDGSLFMLAGNPVNFSEFSSALLKFTPNGILDSQFGFDGVVLIPEGDFSGSASFTERYESAAIDRQGRVVIGGQSTIRRYTRQGTIDTSFGDNGRLILPGRALEGTARLGSGIQDVAVDSNDDVIAIGGGDRTFLIRVNTDGSLDSLLSDDGVQRPDIVPRGAFKFLEVNARDELLIAGEARLDAVVYRLDFQPPAAGVTSVPVAALSTESSPVDVTVSGGRIRIQGDAEDNDVNLVALGEGPLLVWSATTQFRVDGVVAHSHVLLPDAGDLQRLHIQLRGGDDRLTLLNFDTAAADRYRLSVQLGDGNDTFIGANGRFAGTMIVQAGKGNDEIYLDAFAADGRVVLKGAAGDDVVRFDDELDLDRLRVLGGSGSDGLFGSDALPDSARWSGFEMEE